MTSIELLLLTLVGCFVGALNTLAAGGSLLAVPLLMWFGLPAIEAAATSRPAIVFQNIVAILSFRQRGVYQAGLGRRAFYLGLVTVPGAILGSWVLASHVSGEVFERILGGVMVAVALVTWRRRRRATHSSASTSIWVLLAFFGIVGLYGGFIQGGVGFVIMAVLFHAGSGQSTAQINAIKVCVVLMFCLTGVVVLALTGKIHPLPAACLAVGQGLGGYVGARLSIGLAERYLMGIYTVLLLVFAVLLLV